MPDLDEVKSVALAHARERHTPLHEFLAHLKDGNPGSSRAQLLVIAQQALLQLLKERRVQLERTVLLANHYRQVPFDVALGVLNRRDSWQPPDPGTEPGFFCFKAVAQ